MKARLIRIGNSRGVRVAELPLDAPVVRQIERAPAGIVEPGRLGAGEIPQVKAPPAIEVQRSPLGRRRPGGKEQRAEGRDGPVHPM